MYELKKKKCWKGTDE